MKGKLVRSFGFDDTEDQVVELSDGHVIFRREPGDRKLKRGEKLPELRVNVAEACADLGGAPAKERDVADILWAVASRVPIAAFEGKSPDKIAYGMKVWLMKELKRELQPKEEQ